MNMVKSAIIAVALFLSLLSEARVTPGDIHRCWNKSRGFSEFSEAFSAAGQLNNTTDTLQHYLIPVVAPGVAVGDFEFRFRLRNNASHPSGRYEYYDQEGKSHTSRLPEWCLTVESMSGEKILFRPAPRDHDNGLSLEPCMEIECSILSSISGDGTGSLLGKTIIRKGLDMSGRSNIFTISRKRGKLLLSGGLHSSSKLMECDLPNGFTPVSVGFSLYPAASINADDIRVSYNPEEVGLEKSVWTDSDLLEEYLHNSSDAVEGYWLLLDRTLDDSLLRLGGDYRLAAVRSADGYDFIYLGGGKTNAGLWSSGMVKMRLRPSGIEGVWNIEWIDSDRHILRHEVRGQFEADNTLRIQFPHHSSQLRFVKTSEK